MEDNNPIDTPIQKTITVPATTVTYNAEEHGDIVRQLRESLALIGRYSKAIKEGLKPENNDDWLDSIINVSDVAYKQAGRL